MSTGFKVVIPARYASTRLPGKPLLPLAGKPMIAHVCCRAVEADAQQVVVATDHQGIFDAVADLGLQVVMTGPDHASGTERIAEAARILGWGQEDIVVNLQGDEPLIPPSYIREVAEALAGQDEAGVATLAAEIDDVEDVFNPNAVKVVLDRHSYALYFSRAPIPWDRAAFPQRNVERGRLAHLRHIGIYAYRVGFLDRYCSWPASQLEHLESLEQLRILWMGEKIRVGTVPVPPEAGVDTEADLLRVEKRLRTSAEL